MDYPATKRSPKAAPKTVSVAIVDDHRLLLESLASRLNDDASRISVNAAETTWGGLVTHPSFPFDVVVLDLHLDDGIPIGTKLRALSASGTAAVVMSRHAHAASVTAALRAGARAFVPKTEPVGQLISAIHSAAENANEFAESLAASIAAAPAMPDPGLGPREQRALMLYASGRSTKEVATAMGTTDETVKSYIKRARRKYRESGVDLGTRIRLRLHGIREGWLAPD